MDGAQSDSHAAYSHIEGTGRQVTIETRARRRAEFLTSIAARLSRLGATLPEVWFGPVYPEDPLVVSWRSDAKRRTLRIQERDEDDSIEFDWVIGKSGEDDFDDLLVEVKYCDRGVDLLFEIFRQWFVDDVDIDLMKTLLEERTRADDSRPG